MLTVTPPYMGDELYIDRDVGSIGATGATTCGLFSNAVDVLRVMSADFNK
jgi:hypothetical protein